MYKHMLNNYRQDNININKRQLLTTTTINL